VTEVRDIDNRRRIICFHFKNLPGFHSREAFARLEHRQRAQKASLIFDATLIPAIMIALAAGLLSFLSPCVLPIVPPYLAYMGGVSMGEMEEERTARRGVLCAWAWDPVLAGCCVLSAPQGAVELDEGAYGTDRADVGPLALDGGADDADRAVRDDELLDARNLPVLGNIGIKLNFVSFLI